MADGLYLYCVREKADTIRVFSAKGIDGKNGVFVFPHRELEAVVSGVPMEEFNGREDLNWIKEKAIIHEQVIEEAMKKGRGFLGLVPMRFGVIFKNETGLKTSLDKNYSKIMSVLKKIRGKQEWGLKIYLKDKGKFSDEIKRKSALVKAKEAEMNLLPEGAAYFMEGELKGIVSEEMNRELDGRTKSIFEDLKGCTADAVKCKVLQRELTGIKEDMVLNAAYLVSEEKVGDFKKEVEDLNQKICKDGFSVRYSGPWPAYNFTQLEL